jgi:phosphoribosylformylglycinamidine cyclo-ligase
MDYKQAGVSIEAGDEAVRRIRALARGTFTPGVLSDIGTFGGLFLFDTARWPRPVLVSSSDGVGTKLRLAFMTGVHDTVGADLVNHCVNDILVHGAEPLFFLDYLATGRLDPAVAASVVSGIARACGENRCALIGGETAEMPGFYADGEYDLAGFIVGVVDRERLITGAGIERGDRLIGLPSTGLHTNGYSLARRIVFEAAKLRPDSRVPELDDSIGAALLRTHRSYLHAVRPLMDAGLVRGLAHITGGGIPGNLNRILPEGTGARVDRASWQPPAIFRFLERAGAVPPDEMFKAFNMGIGLILVCAPGDVDRAIGLLAGRGERPVLIGDVRAGNRTVEIA